MLDLRLRAHEDRQRVRPVRWTRLA